MTDFNTNIKLKNSIIVIIMLGIIVVAGYAFWHRALYAQKSLQEVVAIEYGGTQAMQEKKIQAMRKEVHDTLNGRIALRKLAIKEDQVSTFLNNLEALGNKKVPVFVRSVDVQKEGRMVSVSLAFSGDFNDIMLIVKNILNEPYALYIDTFELRTDKKIDKDNNTQDVSMRITMPLLGQGKI